MTDEDSITRQLQHWKKVAHAGKLCIPCKVPGSDVRELLKYKSHLDYRIYVYLVRSGYMASLAAKEDQTWRVRIRGRIPRIISTKYPEEERREWLECKLLEEYITQYLLPNQPEGVYTDHRPVNSVSDVYKVPFMKFYLEKVVPTILADSFFRFYC